MNSTSFQLPIIIILIIRPVVSGIVSSRQRNPVDVCWARQCRDVADMLEKTMKRAVAPCNDFYEYACGTFIGRKVNKDDIRWLHYDRVKHIAEDAVIKYLKAPLNDTDSPLITWAKYQFKACMNERRLDELGIQPLLDKLNEYGGRTMCRKVNIQQEKKWYEIHDMYNRLMGKGSVFTIGIKYISHYQENLITVGITGAVFGHTKGSLQYSDIENYTQLLIDMSEHICRISDDAPFTKDHIEAIERVIQFREALTKIKDMAKTSTTQCAIPIYRLREITKGTMRNKPLDWLRLLQSTFQSSNYGKITDVTWIYIENLPHILTILKIIDDTPEEVIIDHIQFYFMETYIGYSNMKIDQKAHTGVSPLRSRACVTDRALTRAFNFIYMQHILPKDTVLKAEQVAQDVRRTLNNQISRTAWMSKFAKQIVTENVDKRYDLLQYADWDKDVYNVPKYYANLPISQDYMQNTFNYDSFSYSKALSLLRNQPNQPRNMGGPTATCSIKNPGHATRIDHTNIIAMPMSVLHLPRFGAELPLAVNYAGYGATYGKLLADAVDTTSREQSESAKDQWNGKRKNKYMDRRVFYENRIGAFVPVEFSAAKIDFKINPKVHIDQAVSEYMGLVAAYEAYRKRKSSEKYAWDKLIDYENLGGDKLFFVAYALNHCEAINARAFQWAMNISEESVALPSRLIVNVALSNMKAFSKAFGCKGSDPMNPLPKRGVFN